MSSNQNLWQFYTHHLSFTFFYVRAITNTSGDFLPFSSQFIIRGFCVVSFEKKYSTPIFHPEKGKCDLSTHLSAVSVWRVRSETRWQVNRSCLGYALVADFESLIMKEGQIFFIFYCTYKGEIYIYICIW